MPPAATLNDDTINLIDTLRSIEQQIKEHQDIAKALKAKIIDALGNCEVGVDSHGVPAVTYKPVRKFDTSLALTYLTDQQITACTTLLDTDAVKKQLTGEQLQECMRPGDRRFGLPR